MPRKLTIQSNSRVLATDTTSIILTTLRDVSRVTNIPYLHSAAVLALGILDIIQASQDNNNAFQRLGDDACNLVYTAILSTNSLSRASGISQDLLDNLSELLNTLHAVEQFAKKKVSRRKMFKLIAYKSDAGDIGKYGDKIRHSLDLFGLKSSIMIQENVTHLAAQQEELVNSLKDREMQRDIRRETNAGKMVRRTKQGAWEQERTERVANEAMSTMFPVPLIATMNSQPKTYLVGGIVTSRFSAFFFFGMPTGQGSGGYPRYVAGPCRYRTRRHGRFIIGSTFLSLIGYIMLLSSQNRHVRYGSTFLTVLGAGIAGGMYTSWATAHAMPGITALVSTIGTLGSIAASWMYLRRDVVPGMILNIVCTAIASVIAVGTVMYVRWENRRHNGG